METTPRPTIDVECLEPDSWLERKRKRYIESVIPRSNAIVRKYRQKQQSLTEDSDPDPFDRCYLFYCFTRLIPK